MLMTFDIETVRFLISKGSSNVRRDIKDVQRIYDNMKAEKFADHKESLEEIRELLKVA